MGPARRFCTPGLSGGISRRTGISKVFRLEFA